MVYLKASISYSRVELIPVLCGELLIWRSLPNLLNSTEIDKLKNKEYIKKYLFRVII